MFGKGKVKRYFSDNELNNIKYLASEIAESVDDVYSFRKKGVSDTHELEYLKSLLEEIKAEMEE